SPSTLQQLAIRSLLKDEALVISALKEVPMELFPTLFKGAFHGKQTDILTAMEAAWPFVKNFLSVSSLKKLLQHTANLRHLAREVHPAPEEIYDSIGIVMPTYLPYIVLISWKYDWL
ncbi:PRAME family member 20/21, partial [Cricetulus griseus]